VSALPPGTTIGAYVIDGEVARGGMGAVYRARRRHDGALVALKVMHAGGATTVEQRERFRREAQLAAGLVHPGIVRVHDAGEVGPLSYLAMDLIEGEALAARVGTFAPREAARLVAQVARAIEHAHAHGVIHRDLKPGNVLLRRDDGAALVTDFGVARHLESAALTKTGAMVGTPTYLSPEQAGGLPATPASDVHALGAVLYELLTGLPPFRRDDLQSLLVAITTERPEPPSVLTLDVPKALDRVCLAALAKSPAARPGAGELAAELEAIADGRTVVRPRGRVVSLVLALALVLVLVLALVLAQVTGAPAPEPGPPPSPATSSTSLPPPPPTATPAAPAAWSEPPWLRELAERGDSEALLAAHTALDALEDEAELDPRTRARAIDVVTELDRRWTPPSPTDPERTFAGDRLAWIHWLWRRVDPTYVFPADREALLEAHILDVTTKPRPQGDENGAYVARAGRANIALQPRQTTGYLLYASGIKNAPWSPRTGPLLRAAMALVEDQGPLWSLFAASYAGWLAHVARASDPPGLAARAELLDLARAGVPRTDLATEHQVNLLVCAAEYAAPDEAAALLARAAELGPGHVPLLGRARLLGRQGELDAARREAEAAGKAAVATFDFRMAVRAFTLAAELQQRAGRPARALDNLDRALAHASNGWPGVALRRVLLLLDDGEDLAALGPAVDDLVARLGQHMERQRVYGGASQADVARLAAAFADATTAKAEVSAPERVAQLLRPWGAPDALAFLEQ
jgi:serine/threonine protein kinase